MTKSAKITISLPAALLQDVGEECLTSGASRSEFLRHALESYLRLRRESQWDEEYAEAYRDAPEGEEEAAYAKASLLAWADSPWEDGEGQ